MSHNGVYGYFEGCLIEGPDWTPVTDPQPEQWPWYKAALLTGGGFAYTDVYEKDGKAVIMADVIKLDQILNNLISNAVKYTCSGDSIHVAA